MGASLTAQPAASPRPAIWLDNLLIVSEWAFVLAAAGLWAAFKTYHPFMNAGVGLWAGSWVARWLRTGKLSRFTPLDLPMLGFCISLGAGWWAAPDQLDATARAFLFLGAIGIFYSVANSGLRTLQVVCIGFMAGMAVFGVYFATQQQWAEEPAKFLPLQAIGLALNKAVPDLGLYKPHPNVVVGVVAIAMAIWLVLFYFYFFSRIRPPFQGRWIGAFVAYLLLGAVLAFSLVMTQSRTAWLAVAGAVGLGLWALVARALARLVRTPARIVFCVGLAIVLGVGLGVLWAQPELLTRALGTLPGPNSAVSRIEIYKQVWWLAQDTPFTGGGLGSFPGLYSTYILSVPSLYLTHAHNAFLNVLLEQGWLGAASFAIIILVASFVALPRLTQVDSQFAPLIVAGGLGVVVIVLQGMGDATLVASRVMPFLFFPAGLVFAGPAPNAPTKSVKNRWIWFAVPIAAVAGVALLYQQPLRAQWYANLGAVEQNRIALISWPTNEWDTGEQAGLLGAAESLFEKSLTLNPNNETALFRLGLIRVARQDWQRAAQFLQSAYDLNPNRRGLIKNLGYTYAWLGDYDTGRNYLTLIPEARDELSIYIWWWNERAHRPEQSQNAINMLGRMP